MPLCFALAPVRRLRLLTGLLLCAAVGCGVDQYEFRLKHSKDYYNAQEKIEQNLATKWTDGRVVDSIRVPRQFQPIPAPVPTKTEDGQEEWPSVDPRQPDYINLVFPTNEIIGVWEAPFAIVTPDGVTDTRKGYIYVLSNYWKFLEDPAEALKFIGNTVNLIGEALEDRLPQDKIENPPVEQFPKPGKYLPSATFTRYEFQPKPITQRSAERETTINYTFTVYGLTNGNIQSLVLIALPENISSQEKLVDRIPMMLEQFRITRNEPKPSQGPAQNGQAPSAPAGF